MGETMKGVRLAVIFSTILFLVSSIHVTHGATLTKDYEQDFIFMGSNIFSFRIVVTIETEVNEKWMFDNYYYVNLTLVLTYVNETQFDPNFLRILYHSPRLTVNNLPYGHGSFQTIADATNVTTISNGTIAIKYRPDRTDGTSLQLKPLIEYSIYDHDQIWGLEPTWTPSEAIIIDIEEAPSNPLDNTNILIYATAGAIAAIVLTGGYLFYRSREAKNKKSDQKATTTL